MSAWWVQANQVSKTGPGGLLPTGEFVIKGEKNFLAPSQLVLGLAVMFQISQESVKNHKSQRFDEHVSAEQSLSDTGKAEQVVENKGSPRQEEPTAEAAERSENVNGHQEQEKSSESESDDEERADRAPLGNPLQRGISESSFTGKVTSGKTGDAESGAEDEQGEEEVDHGGTQEQEREEPEIEGPGENETPNEEGSPLTEDGTAPSRPESKRHLSARERRLLKKGKPLEPSVSGKGVASETASTTGETTPSTSTKPPPASQPVASKQAPPPARGKKAKGKKASAKYAYQDEEERELALRLLGANNAKAQKAAADAAVKADREREAELQKQRRRAQHERAAEAERKRQALFEQGIGDEYDEGTAAAEAADLAWLPALIGAPLPEDEILAAIPVCAPWAALGRYKYRVKLQPGAVKKGKAVKEILGRWIAETTSGKVRKDHAEEAGINRAAAEKLRAREGELIRGWKDTEIVNFVPVGKVRIMTGGAGGGGGDGKGKGKGAVGKGGKGGKGGKKK